MEKCPKCGEKLEKGAKFCVACGERIENEEMEEKTTKKTNGPIDRAKIKAAAKEMSKNNKWNIWLPTLVISFLTSILVTILCAIFNVDVKEPGWVSTLVSILLSPMSVGMIYYVIKLVAKEKTDLNQLFQFYSKKGLIIMFATLLVGLIVGLGLVALIIPGIILALGYSMTNFLFAKGFDGTAQEALKESRRMMNGHKSEYFKFLLSFIGQFCLVVITLGIYSIWLIPYFRIADNMYKQEIYDMNK